MIRRFVLVLLIVFLSVSDIDAQTYIGTMTVDDYTRKNVSVQIQPSSGPDKVSLILYDVKFAWLMPVTLNVKIDPITKKGNHLAADGIIPTNKEKRYNKYIIRQLEGCIENNSIRFLCQMGKKKLTYNGIKKNE